MVLGSLQQQVAAALYGPLRSFPGLATLAAAAAQCDSERLDVRGLIGDALGQRCGLQLKLGAGTSAANARFSAAPFSFPLVL